MDPFRLASLLTDLEADQRQGLPVGGRLSESTVELVGVTSAGITLITNDRHFGPFGASDEMARRVEDLQFTLGEGPCIDAHASEVATLEPDLAAPAVNRWPQYAAAAVA